MVKAKARLLRIVSLSEARPNLPARTLFHAGPPYQAERPTVILKSAAQAAVLAGWAADDSEAIRLLESDNIRLEPAQDHGFAVPLAMVLAPTMWCVEVGDASSVFLTAMSEGPPPALRFGSSAPECRHRARDWCAKAAAVINSRLDRVPPIEDMIAAAVEDGDECHALTSAGNQLFVEVLGDIPRAIRDDLLSNAGFSLSIWMAWSGWKLRSSESAIEAIGGNGVHFGWRPRGERAWRTTLAPCPTGTFFKQERSAFGLGAIGDSAVVDICGLGGQALRFAPKLLDEWSQFLPPNMKARHNGILDSETGIVSPDLVVQTGLGPIVNLAIVDREGGGFPIGRGIFLVPPALFTTGN